MENKICTLQKLNFQIGNFKLTDINFDLNQGEIIGLIGENGSGKTTLLRLIANLYRPDSGKILTYNHLLAFAFDSIPFPLDLTIKNLESILAGIFLNWDQKYFASFIKKLKLPTKCPLGTFSKGMKMQLNVVVNLCFSRHLLLFDEVTSGLDPLVTKTILENIKEHVRKKHCGAILTTHNLSDVKRICDRIIFLSHGEKVLERKVTKKDTVESLENLFTRKLAG